MKVLVTQGAYSDYGVVGFYEVPSVPWLREQLEEWLTQHPDQREHYHFRESEFMKWLETLPGVHRHPYTEVHLGSYGNAQMQVYENQLMADDDDPVGR